MTDSRPDWRSQCPLNIALEILGDKWTLLILRDLMFKGFSTYKQFQESGEKIATNILAVRLKKLMDQGIIASKRSPTDARVISYRPTAKGLDLLPTMVELIIWADRYEETAAPPHIMQRIQENRNSFIADTRRRFESDESTSGG